MILIVIFLCVVISGIYYLAENHNQAPAWRRITPGESSQDDVLNALGQPDQFLTTISTWIYEDSPLNPILPPVQHKVIFSDDVVWLIVTEVYDLNIEDLITQYGTPEDVLWAHADPHTRQFLYCSQGVFASVQYTFVHHIYYFKPVSLSQCADEFDDYIAVNNPIANTDFKMMRDPWGYTLPADIPNSILNLWPRPDHELPLSAYNDYITYRAPEHGVGVWISLGVVSELGIDGFAYEELLKEQAVLELNGEKKSNDVLWVYSAAPVFKPEDEALFELSWDTMLPPDSYTAKFTYIDHLDNIHTYSWDFVISDE